MKLIIENVKKNYGQKKVLEGIDFEFEDGKIYGLLGVNGSGKTTFFDLINKDVPLTAGEIYVSDNNQKKKISTDIIGYVRSTPMVPDFLTARELVEFYLEVNEGKIDNVKTTEEYLDDFYIAREDRDKLLKEYSHGMKNKILMLINFVNNPKILLLDEPLTSFDPVISDNMKKKLLGIKKDKFVIVSTHIMEIAIDLCDEIVLLKDGKFEVIDNVKLGKVKSEKLILKHLKEIN
ncbi:MAG: ABC transporter ATP-binding protein [bacterium]